MIGSAELQRREAELQQAGADVAAGRRAIARTRSPEDAITTLQNNRSLSSVTDIVSSIEGIVLERKATIGQIVQAVEPVFMIADLVSCLARRGCAGAERRQHKGRQSREAEIPALPGHKDQGHASRLSARR